MDEFETNNGHRRESRNRTQSDWAQEEAQQNSNFHYHDWRGRKEPGLIHNEVLSREDPPLGPPQPELPRHIC